MKKYFSLLLLSFLPLLVQAATLIDGISYNLNSSTKTAKVTSKSGEKYTGTVNIPPTVVNGGITYSVTSIDSSAFSYCSGLTSVTIPNSVTSIGDFAFEGCSGLTSVTIPNSVTSIGTNPFSGCSGLTSIEVESGNTKYDSRNNCNAIIESSTNTLICGCKNTTIPNSVTSIGDDAFEITPFYNSMADGVIYLGKCLYKYKGTMSENTRIVIEEGTIGISPKAFYNCSGLTSVTIPNSVTYIGGSAFEGCSGLTSVTIPNSVTSIGWYAFRGCI